MTFSLILLGLLSSLALGPAGFSIVRLLIQGRRWPWAEICGFLIGDFIYIVLSLLLMQTSFLKSGTIQNTITILTSLVLLIFSLSMLLKKSSRSKESLGPKGFWQSLALALASFHMVLIYTGIFAGLLQGSFQNILQGALAYGLSFALGFLGLLKVLQAFQNILQRLLRQIEVFVGFGFIFFSFYLTWGTL